MVVGVDLVDGRWVSPCQDLPLQPVHPVVRHLVEFGFPGPG